MSFPLGVVHPLEICAPSPSLAENPALCVSTWNKTAQFPVEEVLAYKRRKFFKWLQHYTKEYRRRTALYNGTTADHSLSRKPDPVINNH